MSKNIKEDKIIKETKYCKIINQGKVGDDEYTYTIEKIYIKELKRNEIRFCVYKSTRRGDETYIPRSLDVTELELMELIKKSIKEKVLDLNEYLYDKLYSEPSKYRSNSFIYSNDCCCQCDDYFCNSIFA